MAIDRSCGLCSPEKSCEFHAAGTVEQLVSVVTKGIRKKGAIYLARFLTSAIARLEHEIPPALLDAIDELDVDDLEAYVQRKLSAKAEMSPRDLRELAGCFIALALLADEDDDEEDEDD